MQLALSSDVCFFSSARLEILVRFLIVIRRTDRPSKLSSPDTTDENACLGVQLCSPGHITTYAVAMVLFFLRVDDGTAGTNGHV